MTTYDYDEMSLEEVVAHQRIDDGSGWVQYPEFPRDTTREFFDEVDYNTNGRTSPRGGFTTSVEGVTFGFKERGDLRFGYPHPEMDAAYQKYLREKRRPRRLEAYAEDRNGVASKNRERNRKAYAEMMSDPEKAEAYRARKRAERQRRAERDG
jgi:hypothetical protein